MKTKSILLLPLVLVMFTACAHVHQNARSTTTDPKTGITSTKELETTITSSGTSKQTIEALRASASDKTLSTGAAGSSQESTQNVIIDSIAPIINQVVKALVDSGFAAGRASVLTNAAAK
jgi:hypothetical protein